MTKTEDLIDFLEQAYAKIGEQKLWIIKDICRHHDIVMTNEWNSEKGCPVFKPREYRGRTKDIFLQLQMRKEYERDNDYSWL